jgi:hypothetical protein
VIPQYTPTIPTLVREPFHRPGWVYEETVDGWRMLAYKDGDRGHDANYDPPRDTSPASAHRVGTQSVRAPPRVLGLTR